MSEMFDAELFDRAVKKAGGYAVVAAELGLTRQAVNLWKTQPIPPERLADLGYIINMPPAKLRPDLAKLFRTRCGGPGGGGAG